MSYFPNRRDNDFGVVKITITATTTIFLQHADCFGEKQRRGAFPTNRHDNDYQHKALSRRFVVAHTILLVLLIIFITTTPALFHHAHSVG